MGKLRNIGMGVGGAGLGYLGLKTAANEGVEAAEVITNTVDSVAHETANLLEGSWAQIGDLAPVSQVFINELSSVLAHTSLLDAGIATGVGIGAGWLGKKGSEILGDITGIQSEHDNSVAKIGTGMAGALGVLGAGASAITLGAGTGGYVLGRKLGEKILGEKYAKLLGILGAVGGAGLAWGAAPGAILGLTAAGVGGGLVWNALGVSENWSRQNAKRKEQGFMKTHLGIGRRKKKS